MPEWLYFGLAAGGFAALYTISRSLGRIAQSLNQIAGVMMNDRRYD